MKKIRLGLVAGRHDIPEVNDYVFTSTIPNIKDTFGIYDRVTTKLGSEYGLSYGDQLDLYVTGLTVALGAAIRYCAVNGVQITLYHYDRETEEYFPQIVL